MTAAAGDDQAPILSPMAGRGLLAFGVVYSLLHHQGFVLGRLGSVGDTGTRWADWIDLATPYLVLAPVAFALAGVRPAVRTRVWLIFAAGALAYTQGHGIHLAANSLSNLAVDEALTNAPLLDVVHLWDEQVGHYVWYGGLSLVLIALTAAVRRQRLVIEPATMATACLVAVLAGLTYATNALEGHFAWPGLAFGVVLAALLALDRRRRRADPESRAESTAADLVLVGLGVTLLVLGFYGTWHRGFPDPSSVGWNLLAR